MKGFVRVFPPQSLRENLDTLQGGKELWEVQNSYYPKQNYFKHFKDKNTCTVVEHPVSGTTVDCFKKFCAAQPIRRVAMT